jgi:NAD(P)-dependent dehydrogenase (short-subunit alcohol dehydrogenase family)
MCFEGVVHFRRQFLELQAKLLFWLPTARANALFFDWRAPPKKNLIVQFFYKRRLGIILICLVIGLAGSMAQARGDDAQTVLITGSNRGIGLEFARQYAEQGWRVIATCRRPDEVVELAEIVTAYPNVTIKRLDVTDHAGINALAAEYEGVPIDLLINNAGILGGALKSQRFGQVDYAAFRQAMAVNAVGPLKMAEAFAPHIAASAQKKIINITSVMGSLDNAGKSDFNRRIVGGLFIYPPSKTALNLMMRTLALELEDQGVIVTLIHPGGVNTEIVPVPGFLRAIFLTSPKKAVRRMIALIDTLGPEQSGLMLHTDGEVIPW